jgi:deoxyribonuclease-4
MKPVEGLLFGTGGAPEALEAKDTVSAIRFLKSLGLDAMELEFVRGTFPGVETARMIARTAEEHGIRLTAHGPYFINLNSPEPDKVVASRERIVKTAHIGSLCGAESVTFHAGFYQEAPPDAVFRKIEAELARVMEDIRRRPKLCVAQRGDPSMIGAAVDVRPETTGKPSQFGSLDEVLRLSAKIEGLHPCIDWSHLHARTGAFNSAREFRMVLDAVRNMLGESELTVLHMHVSGIQFGPHGEKKHVDVRESDFNYKGLFGVLKDSGVSGFLICESPHREDDALLMKELYEKL